MAASDTPTSSKGPLDGLIVLDLSRILAGPTCTQALGDLGATIIKIEHPERGDDTRTWGPPFATGTDGAPTDLSSYFMCTNRNKLSVAVDISSAEGQETIRQIAARSDILIENFKPGGLVKYGLDHETMLTTFPKLIHCSISGFGHTGPNSDKPGYDLMAQGYSGIMSLTGDTDGMPTKVAVGIADVMTGMYASVGILAALRHRDRTGQGQHIDLSLVDASLAWMINEGVAHLTTGQPRPRRGNEHATIVPYQTFACADGFVLVAVGNDLQYTRFCDFLGRPDLADDPRFATNSARVVNRETLIPMLEVLMKEHSQADIVAGLEARKVPVGPVNTVEQAFSSDQARARDMRIDMAKDGIDRDGVELIGNPLKFSATPVTYRRPPPHLGEDTAAVLEWLSGARPAPDA
ncbi:CaiB/BaiF CoA transferase family protein [Jannaschia sp. CCS1]|uniref:CaiB/BaiF CoA transferase family protein n=1 Tax=Jannaschia sp. (strain CCS1) TaxID=290400 RepID=UPI000053CA63|nr:CaiB/BaiF CoA-transferase family protein [Jannaschia sp. CCS1]ABD56120.1 L-carnitine dehydratase/bile acid-inducible protein F [Jannaschia sp. CCS1]